MFFGAGAWAPTKHVRGGQTVELRALKAALGGTGGGGGGGGVCLVGTGHPHPPPPGTRASGSRQASPVRKRSGLLHSRV
jgi:hypothetical protein